VATRIDSAEKAQSGVSASGPKWPAVLRGPTHPPTLAARMKPSAVDRGTHYAQQKYPSQLEVRSEHRIIIAVGRDRRLSAPLLGKIHGD
jgi:hypothetical protein